MQKLGYIEEIPTDFADLRFLDKAQARTAALST
jgi:hypothetical protein